MTLPSERTRAVLETEKFLINLCDPKVTPGLPKVIRQRARSLLRHYPSEFDFKLVISSWGESLVGFVSECPFGDPNKTL